MAEETPKPPPPPPGPSKLPLILGIVNMLLTGGVLAVLFLKPPAAAAPKGGAEHSESSGHAEKESGGHGEGGEGKGGAGPTLKLADFVIHLRNPEAERYARLSMELELKSELDKEKLNAYVPRLRDAFVAYLSDRTAEELAGSEALAKVKAALLKLCEELVPGGKVRALYFTDFVVQ